MASLGPGPRPPQLPTPSWFMPNLGTGAASSSARCRATLLASLLPAASRSLRPRRVSRSRNGGERSGQAEHSATLSSFPRRTCRPLGPGLGMGVGVGRAGAQGCVCRLCPLCQVPTPTGPVSPSPLPSEAPETQGTRVPRVPTACSCRCRCHSWEETQESGGWLLCGGRLPTPASLFLTAESCPEPKPHALLPARLGDAGGHEWPTEQRDRVKAAPVPK